MIAWLALSLALADEPDTFRLHRITGVAAPSGASIRLDQVVGPDGGVGSLRGDVRYTHRLFSVGIGLPAVWTVELTGRRAAAGNLQLDAGVLLETGPLHHEVGVEGWFPVGGRAFGWINRPEDSWPGGGVRAVWEVRSEGPWRILGRLAIGALFSEGVDPVPGLALDAEAAIGLDRTVVGPFGLATELAGGWFDTSPLDWTVLARVEPVRGLHLRTGIVMPVGTWAGWSAPAAGAREATWFFGLGISGEALARSR